MNLKNLQTFLVLSKFKNFTKTAQQLGYVQSSVTNQIQQLEGELNVCLFERFGKSVSLTPEGKQLIPYAQKLVALSADIEDMYTSTQTGGSLRIGASESLGIFRLPDIMKLFRKTHPDSDLHLDIVDSSEFIGLLANHSIDLAFTLDKHISDSSIITALEIEEPICVLAPPDHCLAQKESVKIQDFSGMPFIFTGRGCCYRSMFEQELSAYSVLPHIVLETSSIQVIKESTICGLGLCVLPELTVKQEIARGELIKLPYIPHGSFSSQLIYHKEKWLSPNMKAFIHLATRSDG